MRLLNNQPVSPLFPCNLVLWRGVTFTGSTSNDFSSTEIADCPFVKSERGSWVAKIRLNGSFMWEPEIVPVRIGNHGVSGITVFLKEQPPADWTHLMVTGVSRALSERPVGGAVFAKAAKPYSKKDYIIFRTRMFMHVKHHMNCGFERKIETMKKVSVEESRPGQIRQVVDSFLDCVEYEQLLESSSVCDNCREVKGTGHLCSSSVKR